MSEETPVVPDKGKEYPANHMPPKGIEAYQMFRDGNWWSVWRFAVKDNGDIETEKILEREVYDVAKERLLKRTFQAIQKQVR